MAFTVEQQFSRDIDWYFRDSSNNIIHVASAGGKLPKPIVDSDDFINELHSTITELALQFEAVINPALEQIISFENEEARNLYLQDFIEMAQRGLISIDKSILGNFDDSSYHIVAYPKDLQKPERLTNDLGNIYTSKRTIDINNSNSFELFNYFE